MATHVSPGVYSKIIDLSEYLVSTSGTIGFVPVITEQGRDNQLIKVSGSEDYITQFGDPNIKTFGKYYGQGPYVATQHLSVSSDLYVIRALPDDAVYAHAFVAFTNPTNSADDVVSSTTQADDTDSSVAPTTADDVNLDSGVKITTFYANHTNTNGIPSMTSTMKLDNAFTSGGTSWVVQSCPGIYTEKSDKSDANLSVLFYVRGVGRGDFYNNMSFLIRSSGNPLDFGTYVFEIYKKIDGTDTLVESYNVSFDPEGLDSDGESSYIENVINKWSKYVRVSVNIDALPRLNKFLFDFYKNDPTIALTQPDYVVEPGFPANVAEYRSETIGVTSGIYIGDQLVVNPDWDNPVLPVGYDLGTKAMAIWNAYFRKAYADMKMDEANTAYKAAIEMDEDDTATLEDLETHEMVQMSRNEAIERAVTLIEIAQALINSAEKEYQTATAMCFMSMTDSDEFALGDQTFALKNGSLGAIVYTKNGKRIVNSVIANQVLCHAYSGLLKNPESVKHVDESTGSVTYHTKYCDDVLDLDWIYFTIVYDAGYKPDVKQSAKDLVETRCDCVLISDCGDNSDCESVEKYVGSVKGATDCRIWNSFYCARFEPYTRIYDKWLGCDEWISPVYTMAKIIPQNDSMYGVWYAPAGFNRGVTSEVKELRWNANHGERDRLYVAQVNPIVYFPEGMTVFSQLTTQKKTSTLSDLNCVRTVLYVKRAVEQFCRSFLFEFNDQTTWNRIKEGITPMLDVIVGERGLKSYEVEVGATDYEFKIKTCHVNITLVPMKVIEKIQINLYVK